MSNTSCMFLSNVSIVDHAYIDERGNVVGGSFNPSFMVSGEIDPVEQVVVDFSAVKKQVKAAIDHKEYGFDHKLWFIQGYSNGELTQQSNQYKITTPTTVMTMPIDAVKVIPNGVYSVEDIGNHFAELVERELRVLHPQVNITVTCVNSIDCHTPTPERTRSMFRYAHGLKDSTSWGCKNIAHGHLSYIQLLPVTADSGTLVIDIADDLDDVIFVFAENIIYENEYELGIGYTTERGKFTAVYSKPAYKLRVLETETTVEHLVEYVVGSYHDRLESAGVKQVLVSEGLSKGAMINLS